MPQPSSGDVVVVGGGVIGLGIAWRAAQAGMAVTVVDQAPGRAASWAAAGMLAPVTEVHYGERPLLGLNLAAAARWPGFAAEVEEAAGRPVGYRPGGTLAVARDADDNAALEDLYRFQLRCGLQVERLRSRECRQLEPGLHPGIRGGVLAAGDHQVDNRALVEALLVACERAGVRMVAGRVAELAVEGDRVTGVRLAGGGSAGGGPGAAGGSGPTGDGGAAPVPTRVGGDTLSAGAVVLAAGCWSGGLGGLGAEALPPVRPVKGQLLYLRGPADQPLCSRNVRGLEVYVVPRGDGRVVVGATVEEQGFDTRVTAGAVHDLLRAALELLPDVAELELTETVVGLRPGSPDNAPMLGPAGPEGLVVATGHYRNGILLTPVTADAIAELLATGRVPELIAPFGLGRFAAGEPARAGGRRRP
jgi:glycine oxidase